MPAPATTRASRSRSAAACAAARAFASVRSRVSRATRISTARSWAGGTRSGDRHLVGRLVEDVRLGGRRWLDQSRPGAPYGLVVPDLSGELVRLA